MTPTATAHLDQARAAAHHADAIMRDVADRNGSPVHEGANAPWVIDQVAALLRAVRDSTARLCPHVGPGGTIQPLSAAAWDPGRLYCLPCARRLPALDATADATCDRCAKVVNPIYPGAVRFGTILLTWGLCRRCRDETGVPAFPDTSGRSSK